MSETTAGTPELPQHTIDTARTWLSAWWHGGEGSRQLYLFGAQSDDTNVARAGRLCGRFPREWTDTEVLWLFAFVHLYGSAIGGA